MPKLTQVDNVVTYRDLQAVQPLRVRSPLLRLLRNRFFRGPASVWSPARGCESAVVPKPE